MKKKLAAIGIVLCFILTMSMYLTQYNKTVSYLRAGNGTYNDVPYNASYYVFEAGKYLGKDVSGISLYAVKGDVDDTFIYMRGDNTDCYIKDGNEIPVSGNVTAVFSDYKKVTDIQAEIYNYIKIASGQGVKHLISTDNLHANAENFYFAYNNCPVANDLIGYIAYIDDKWLFIKWQDIREYNKTNSDLGSFKGNGIIIEDENIIKMLTKQNMR